jgi:excisionase family DNA binding protein
MTPTTAGYTGDPFAAIVAELRLIRASIDAMKANGATTQPAAGSPWSIADAAKHLGISDRNLSRLVKAGKVKAARFGRRLLIPAAEIERLAVEGLLD